MSQEIFLNEKWKEYHDPAWVEESRFLVSNYGRVKSLNSYNKGAFIKGSKLNQYLTISGRSKKNNKACNRYLHRAVAILFVPKREGCEMVIHKDYDFSNNKASNLMWVNKEERAFHQKHHPNVKNWKNRKLSETDVIRLKRILHDPNRKTRHKIIARQFGISEMQLHRIKSGENWGHIEY